MLAPDTFEFQQDLQLIRLRKQGDGTSGKIGSHLNYLKNVLTAISVGDKLVLIPEGIKQSIQYHLTVLDYSPGNGQFVPYHPQAKFIRDSFKKKMSHALVESHTYDYNITQFVLGR